MMRRTNHKRAPFAWSRCVYIVQRPREMARLQGVPEWLPVPKSEQAANSLMGNAVAAHVVAHVAQRLALGRPVTAGDRR